MVVILRNLWQAHVWEVWQTSVLDYLILKTYIMNKHLYVLKKKLNTNIHMSRGRRRKQFGGHGFSSLHLFIIHQFLFFFILSKILDSNVLCATTCFTISSVMKIWGSIVLFGTAYFRIGSDCNFVRTVTFSSLRIQLCPKCWYFCKLHIAISLVSATFTNIWEKTAKKNLATHKTMLNFVSDSFSPCKIANTKTSCCNFPLCR